ncbi:unnamed protein product [Calypogeia fissa]
MVGILESPIPIEPMPVVGPIVDAAGPPKRIKRLERPNKATLDEDVAKVFDEIDGFQGRIAEIKALIDSKQQNKQITSAEVLDARTKLNELTASFRKVMDEKKVIREELDHADKLRERMRADARAVRDKLPYVRMEQIDEEVKKLEYRMSHTSLTLQEEKKLLQQVKDLTKSRDFVKDYNDRLDQITQDEGSRGEILDKIREKDAILNDLRAKQEEQRKVLAQIKEKDASHTVDIPALIEERNEAFEKIKVLREQVKEIKAEFRNKEEEYWERERQWKEQQALQRRREYEKREADRKEREKIRKQREAENYIEPYTDEIIMVDQLSSYLQKYAPAVEEAAAAAAAGASSTTPQKAEIVAPKGVGTVLVSKKNKFDEETDSWFSGKSKGKKAKAPAPKNKGKEKLSLSLDALTSFEKLKLPPPTTVGDVTKSIEDLRLKKEEYLKLQEEARKRRERGEPEPKVVKEEEEEPAPKVVETPTLGPSILIEPTPAEARNGVMKVENVVAPEKAEEVALDVNEKEASDVNETVEVKAEEDQEPMLPADLERGLPEDLETKLPEDLEAKFPEDLETKVADEDVGTKLPEENGETKHPEEDAVSMETSLV